MNPPTSPSERYDRGTEILARIDGSDGQTVVDSLGDLGRYLGEFGFGGVYARPGLPLRDRELITVAMLAAMRAHESQLDFHLFAAHRVGISVDELREVIINVIPYAGFPAAINAVYDLRTNSHFTLKKNPLRRRHLDEFVELYNPERRHEREATWSEDNSGGRWRLYSYEEILRREGANLGVSWIRDKTLEDSADLADPDIIAEEIADELEAALAQFATIAADLRSREPAE